ncbi:uncharacterized protein LOC108666287 [Hyalella azteca]|uniref:Uncharacterized protein LOC108666287 n=1 Tax=Hyalella azteca TaxID=294128 RepID=A0A8B7N5M8_HYAAZ|nr:uncharacterized protein LOC108666287 [Hyalella azteca]XP_047737246.1 uncharacterized protein LOC108666287 [Hyalella azteca]
MASSAGYINSQTWEAWYESWLVVYGNASMVLMVAFLISLAAAAAVYYLPVLQPCHDDLIDHNLLDKKYSVGGLAKKEMMDCSDCNDGSNNDESTGISADRIGEADSLKAEDDGFIFAGENVRRRTCNPQPELSSYDQHMEKEVKNEQLATIHRLMQAQREKFGDTSMDDLVNQMKLYAS